MFASMKSGSIVLMNNQDKLYADVLLSAENDKTKKLNKMEWKLTQEASKQFRQLKIEGTLIHFDEILNRGFI